MTKQRRLDEFMKRDVVDLVPVTSSYYQRLGIVAGFDAYYISEPRISFARGEEYTSKVYPLEFPSLRRFYTSDQPITCTLLFLGTHNDKQYLNLLAQFLRNCASIDSLNFDLRVHCQLVKDPLSHAHKIMDQIEREGRVHSNVIGILTRRRLHRSAFAELKAHSILGGVPSHIINLERIREIIAEDLGVSELEPNILRTAFDNSGGFKAYVWNNVVQLYAKAGGIPWVPGSDCEIMLRDSLIVGLSAARLDRGGYYVGAVFAVAYRGAEIHSYIAAETFQRSDLDTDFLRNRGLYIPRRIVETLLDQVASGIGVRFRQVTILQTPVIHEEEIRALEEVLGGRYWVVVHIKASGFRKRVYDLSRNDYAPPRGILLIDKSGVENWSPGRTVRGLLCATGWILLKYKRRDGSEVLQERKLYRGTPAPLELEVVPGSKYLWSVAKSDDRKTILERLLIYTARLTLLLGKLDWEAYTNWPKMPFVIKYARRIAQMLSALQSCNRQSLADEVLNKLRRNPCALRFIM